MNVSTARAAAFEILMRIETTEAYAAEMLHSARFAKLSPADHGLLTELVMGVLRWRGVLDDKVAEHCGGSSKDRALADRMRASPLLPKIGKGEAPQSRKIPALIANNAIRTGHPDRSSANQLLEKFDVEVLTALRLGVYQILFLDRVPRHAAVSESVEMVKRARKRSAAGLVNAVLRKVHTADVMGSPHPAKIAKGGAATPDGRSAHPLWLVERWERIYGPEVARKICEYDQSAPETAVRLMIPSANVGTAAPSCRSSADRPLLAAGRIGPTGGGQPSAAVPTFDQLGAEGIQFEAGRLLTQAAIVAAGDISRTAAFRDRSLVIQDEGSQLVALLVGHGRNILDCCAAPGGKTRIIAERNPKSRVVAMELHPRRAALVKKLVSEGNVHVVAADARNMPFTKMFDRILVDAPCSGTGTLARNPEIKWRLRPEDIGRLQGYQIEILESAMRQVAPGGRIVYSTCSLEPEENVEVIQEALRRGTSFRLVDCREGLDGLGDEVAWKGSLVDGPFLRTLPGVHPCDGFFAAVLEKG